MRIFTSSSATILVFVYLLFQRARGLYSSDKVLVIMLLCLWKMVDSIEDVFYGMYQQQGRLDVGAKHYSIRLILSTVVFCIFILCRLPLWIDSLAVLIFSIISAVFLVHRSLSYVHLDWTPAQKQNITSLLKACLPLFIGTSLSMYVGNAPKYMIDWYLDEATQAIFGYIMMPAFVILVLNQFIYQPIIRDLGELWASGDKKKFVRRVLLQYGVVAGLTLVVIIGGALVGLPILSILFNADLSAYRSEFIVLLVGGGAYALASFVMVPLTTIRFQQCIAIGFAAAAVLSLVLGKSLVMSSGVMGAALLYLILNTVIALFFTGAFFWKVYRPIKVEN